MHKKSKCFFLFDFFGFFGKWRKMEYAKNMQFPGYIDV